MKNEKEIIVRIKLNYYALKIRRFGISNEIRQLKLTGLEQEVRRRPPELLGQGQGRKTFKVCISKFQAPVLGLKVLKFIETEVSAIEL